MRVEIAKQMKEGELNTLYFKDIKFFNDKEKEAFIDFIEKVKQNSELAGKNKPSWKDDSWNDILGTTRYEKLNCWHYHSGPSYDKKKYVVKVKGLALNLDGDTSAEVIHYLKIEENTIFIQVFSPKHEPFPKVNDTPNPILDRTSEQEIVELSEVEKKVAKFEKILSEMDETN